jgi:peptidyl-prolyl cis-trans isomerase SurA
MKRFFQCVSLAMLPVLAMTAGSACLWAAQSSPQVATPPILLDRVIAVINGDVLLESDLEEEMHYAALQPYTVPAGQNDRERALRRLINRTLILQQIRDLDMQNVRPNESDISQRIAEMRKQIPACIHLNCQTEEGWQTFLRENHFTIDQVEAYWFQRLEILNFIEQRFRSGIHIPKEDIEKYYQENFVPEFTKVNASPPDLQSVSSRIEEILLQQRVNLLLQDWLRSLRQRGGVEILDPEFKHLATPEDSEGEGS